MRVRAQTSSGDYPFGQGARNYLVDSREAVAQLIGTRLRLFQGEWFVDTSAGVPWFGSVLGVDVGQTYDPTIRNAILSTPGVVSIEDYSSSVADRSLRVTTRVNTVYGTITVDQVI